jgi:ribonuclease D
VQDSLDLLDSSLYKINPELAVDRIKGAKNMRGPARAVATKLAAWRENEAVRRNRPRQWILRDAALLEIAQAGRVPGMRSRQFRALQNLHRREPVASGSRS